MLHYAGTGWVDLLITLIVICAFAWLLLWAVQRFLPEIYQPARIVIGVIALIAILIRLAPLLGG